jgi:S-adenosylmethionine:tRNA ribosyltransferase-isomerase
VRVAELHYELPEELIARYPHERRDGARLLVVEPDGERHLRVRDLPELLPPGALVVVNDTRVVSARLVGKKESGGRVEALLVREVEPDRWQAMAKSSKRLRAGMQLSFDGGLTATVLAPPDADGLCTLALAADGESVAARVNEVGHVPLPPYLGREDEALDRERYQTRFARVPGAVAAPTAGLHFSDELIAALRERVELAAITLHVGPGTFRPVKVEDLDDHRMHAEELEVSRDAAEAVGRARARGAPVVAIGTTVVRALESAAAEGAVAPFRGETRLLIQPGYRFRAVDALLTNFHLPCSTLLALVCAFAGVARTQRAYAAAIAERYRFYSYGDAMWLPARAPC